MLKKNGSQYATQAMPYADTRVKTNLIRRLGKGHVDMATSIVPKIVNAIPMVNAH